jgi:hypothetical protein
VKKRDRVLAAALVASGLFLAAVAFGPAIMSLFVVPMATSVWALLRVFVLSVDQVKLWTFVALAAFTLGFCRAVMAAMDASSRQDRESALPDRNAALANVGYWRYMLAVAPRSDRDRDTIRRELAKLLLSAYSSKERVARDFSLYRDFESRKIPLPEEVHELLFANASPSTKPEARFRAWLRRVSGRESAEYLRSLERYIEYLRFYMEINDEE